MYSTGTITIIVPCVIKYKKILTVYTYDDTKNCRILLSTRQNHLDAEEPQSAWFQYDITHPHIVIHVHNLLNNVFKGGSHTMDLSFLMASPIPSITLKTFNITYNYVI